MSEEYGDKFADPLVEEYKLYVKMADSVSNRRLQTNSFFVSVLSALFVFLSLIGERKTFGDIVNIAYIAIPILGLILSYVWFLNIRSYRQLNFGKFKVIHQIEQQLPFPCYAREWEIIGKGEEARKYLQLTHVEQYIPLLLAILFLLVLAYMVYPFIAG